MEKKNRNVQKYKIMLSAPDDAVEKLGGFEKLQKLVQMWNRNNESRKVIFDLTYWKTDAPPISGKSAQAQINDSILKGCDALLFAFHTRFGTPTENYLSGTAEEIARHINAGKHALAYHLWWDVQIPDPKQWAMVHEFLTDYSSLYAKVVGLDDFAGRFQSDLSALAEKIQREDAEHSLHAIRHTSQPATDSVEEAIDDSGAWYQKSITHIINSILNGDERLDFILSEGGKFSFDKSLSLEENILIWKDDFEINNDGKEQALKKSVEEAYESAFNQKYGSYNYDTDLRSLNDGWFDPVNKEIAKILDSKGNDKIRVLGVGSNYGLELMQIFGDKESTVELTILDLSMVARNRAKKEYGDKIKYIIDKMDGVVSQAPTRTQDIYLNLRAIHSSGVDVKNTLINCRKSLRRGGLAIFSISNGYLVNGGKYFGLLDKSTKSFDTDKPFRLAERLRVDLRRYGFQGVEIHTGSSEVFVLGKKP